MTCPLRVLVVKGDVDVAEYVRLVLACRAGMQVEVAGDADTAFDSPHDRHQDHCAGHQAASAATRRVPAFACDLSRDTSAPTTARSASVPGGRVAGCIDPLGVAE